MAQWSGNGIRTISGEAERGFLAGEPGRDIDIARRVGGTPRIGAEDRDSFGIVLGEYPDDGLPCCPG